MLHSEPIETMGYAKYILSEVVKLDLGKGAVNYYSKNDSAVIPFENSFRYFGSGFKDKAFALSGDYSVGEGTRHFENMFLGLDPFDDTKKLVNNAITKEEAKRISDDFQLEQKRREKEGLEPLDENKVKIRKVGYDLVLSSGKAVSILIAHAQVTGNKELENKLVEIHRKSCEFTMNEIEKGLICRSGKDGMKKEKNIKMFAFVASHFDSREGDPQLHDHHVLMNYGICEDGKIRALDGLSVQAQINLGTANYRMMEAKLLQEAGFTISSSRVHDDFGPVIEMDFKLNGVSELATKTFSKRTAQIEEHMEQHGSDSKTAAKQTRKKKALNYVELKERWKDEFAEIAKQEPDFIKLDHSDLENVLAKIPTDEEILDLVHRFKHRVAVSEFDIKAVITQVYCGHDDAQEKVRETFDRIVSNQDLLCTIQLRDELGNKQYCSMKLVQADLQIQKFVIDSADSHEHDLSRSTVDQAIADFTKKRGFKLSAEQTNAVRTATQGGVTLVAGFAGVGKSVASEVIANAFKAEQYKVIGVSVSNLASQNLQEEAGIDSVSSAKFLKDYDEGKLKLDAKTVIVFDEAGMASLTMLGRYAEIAEATGAKLILAGDTRQLSPVGDGGNGLKVVESVIAPRNRADLKDIKRQKSDADRKLAIGFYDMLTKQDSVQMYESLRKAGYVSTFKTTKDAIQKLADDYVNHPALPKDKLVIASLNESVIKLNKEIMRQLIAKGTIDNEPIATIKAYTFHAGCPVVFKQSKRFSKATKVINGTPGVVVKSADGTLKVKLESGEIVTIPADFKSLEVAFAKSYHSAQGQSKDVVFPLVDSGSIKNALSLVSFTRMKKEIKYYGATENIEELSLHMHIRDKEAGAFHVLDENSQNQARQIEAGIKPKESDWKTNEKKMLAGVATMKKAMKGLGKQTGAFELLDSRSRKHLRETKQVEFMNTVLDQQPIDLKRMRNETDAEHRQRVSRAEKEHAEGLIVSQPSENISDDEIKRLKEDLDNEADSRYGNENVSHGTYIKTGKTGIAWEEEQRQIALKAQEERVRQERTQSEQTEQEASPGPANSVEPPPLPVEKKPPYAFLAGVVSHYGLDTEQSLQGFSVTRNSNKIIHIDTNKAVSVSVASLATNHAYDVIGELAKNNHFDKNKAVEISVNENLKNFNEAQQKRSIERMLETLLASGIDVDMITIKNEKFKALLDEAKEKNFMSIRQVEIQAEQKPTPLPEVEAKPTKSPKVPKPVGVDVDKLFNGKATQFQEDIYDEVMNRTEVQTEEQPKEKSPAEKYKETLAQQLDDNRAKASDKRMYQSDKHKTSVTETEKKKKKTSFKPK